MPSHQSTPAPPTGDRSTSARILGALPWLWFALSAAWAVIIVITDVPAWPLAIWIATTLGPLVGFRSRLGGSAELRS